MNKKIVIISYYWPPSGGVAHQRWLKFSEYLPDFGYEPVLFIPENADYPLTDEEFDEELVGRIETHRVPIFEVRNLYKRFLGNKRSKGNSGNVDGVFYTDHSERSWKEKLALWIRANCFIPDARKYWIKPCSRAIQKYLRRNPCEFIVSTGPPHSTHIIARRIKKAFPEIKWIADFRDPWTAIEYYEHLPLTKRADRQHHSLERAVINEADLVTVASYSWARDFIQLGESNIETITNGYNPEDFAFSQQLNSGKYVISHVGTLQGDRNPSKLWNILGDIYREVGGIEIELRLSGKLDNSVVNSIKEQGLGDITAFNGFISHKEAIREMRNSSLLLLIINQSERNALGRIPAKLFEYIGAGIPILLIGPKDGDAAQLILENGVGYVLEEEELSKEGILEIIQSPFNVQNKMTDKFSRRNICAQLVELMNALT